MTPGWLRHWPIVIALGAGGLGVLVLGLVDSDEEVWGGDLRFWITYCGVVLTAIGVFWGFEQARGARSAAQAAEEATLDARSKLRAALAIQDVARASALAARARAYLSTRRFEEAAELITDLGSLVTRVKVLAEVQSVADSAGEAQDILNEVIRVSKRIRSMKTSGPSDGEIDKVSQLLSELEMRIDSLVSSGIFGVK